MKNGKKEEAEKIKDEVQKINNQLEENEALENKYAEEIKVRMFKIPNIMHESVPIGKDDNENVEIEKFGEPIVPDYEIPFHGEILEALNGLDLDSARRVAGQGFYYLMGDVAMKITAVTPLIILAAALFPVFWMLKYAPGLTFVSPTM